MKPLFAFAIALVYLTGVTQDSELGHSTDGLLYPDTTMNKLRHIVDSLNLKFKVCELNKVYLSTPQTKAHYISLKGPLSKTALADMQAGISFDQFMAKYPTATVDKELLVIKYEDVDYTSKKPVFTISNVNGKWSYSVSIPKGVVSENMQGKWVETFSDYEGGIVEGFYLVGDFIQKPIPEKYAKWIQYVDCLVDTTSGIYTDNAVRTGRTFEYRDYPKANTLLDYVAVATRRPRISKSIKQNEFAAYMAEIQAWDSLRIQRVDSLRKVSGKFNELLLEAVEEAKQIGSDNDRLEEYIERYYSPEFALQLKRNRIVVGRCSMDESPRYHAMNIARLSAETVKWEIFLRAHLDIMNDRFERVSDGSAAWAGRKTYIKELEVLDINVPDLMMGIVLRPENVSNNHYLGSIGRIGRSLTESANAQEMEIRIMEMITDGALDDYNRALAYYLFKSYNYHQPDKAAQVRTSVSLEVALKTLPHYLTVNIDQE